MADNNRCYFFIVCASGVEPSAAAMVGLGMTRITFVEFFFGTVFWLVMVARRLAILMLVGGPEVKANGLLGLVLPAEDAARHPVLFFILQRNYQLKLAMDGPVASYSRFPQDVEEFGIIWSSRQWSKTI
jgi:hypothetical protein